MSSAGKIICLVGVLVLAAFNKVAGQDSLWNLDRCILFARNNNLSIQQAVLDNRVAKMALEESKWSQLPSVSLSSSYGRSFGRSIDPTTNTFITTTYDYSGLSGSANVLVFGWFKKRNIISKAGLLSQASAADRDQLASDIVLNITTGYLRILLAKEQERIIQSRLELSNRQVLRTEKMLAAGTSNGQDMAQIRTQEANDSITYLKAQLAIEQAKIDLKAILNLDVGDRFDISEIDDSIKGSIEDPELVFADAVLTFNKVRSSNLRLKAAQKDLAIAKAEYYPQLNLGSSAGTNYSSFFSERLPNGETRTMPLGRQLNTNFNQSFSIGLSIPVFSGFTTRYQVKRAKIAIQKNDLQRRQAEQQLKQDIYKACNDVKVGNHTLAASRNAVHLAETALRFAQKRYEKGLISAIEVLIAQNIFFQATSDEASARYDLFFKRVLVEYYKNGLWFGAGTDL